jgi:hypothetical protein
MTTYFPADDEEVMFEKQNGDTSVEKTLSRQAHGLVLLCKTKL